MKILRDIASLFMPARCPVCGGEMPEGARTVCTACRWDAPLTGYWHDIDNPVARKFWGVVPVVNASSFMFFVRGNGYRDLIHGFKYHGRWRQALEMGEWFGSELFRGGLYSGVDTVIPVPLHLRKAVKRGYNQSEYIARGIASALGSGTQGAHGVQVDIRSVVRTRHNPSQALKEHSERWDNVKDIFAVRRPEALSGRHILLVDDVLTTGATISSCAEAIVAAVPDCHISIATLAVSRNDIETA